ncbi:hypothetical protein BS329_29975 [Amycolatopsis coloradensis]|uniref:Uncharacterized protein n=1 Tax=Amycolatopsis coloradensis TaxID=76021 RepID=A0A1R0KK26_9PSEU|nr:WD40 repeat domain-containing protein [Amycolatopsis coloradensis]OLZ46465.1 hypothetical protein BS329_29975 [Amycolatopsis coloradensis]
MALARRCAPARAAPRDRPCRPWRAPPRGKTFAFRHDDGPIQLWDIGDPARFAEPRVLPVGGGTAWSLAFTPDGRTLVASQGLDSSAVTLWDITDRVHAVRLAKLGGSPEGIGHLAFGPIRGIRSTRRGSAGFAATVNSLAYWQDGRTLAIGGSGVQLWQTDTGHVGEEICALATPRITREEWERCFPGLEYAPPCG